MGFLVFFLISTSNAISGQSTKEKLNAVVDGLNDPDPITRLATYEDAMASENTTVKRLALRTALQSNDVDLQALALRSAFIDRNIIAFKLSADDSSSKGGNGKKNILEHYGNSLPLKIESYDPKTGTINGYCMAGKNRRPGRYKLDGSISGREITIQSHCDVSAGNCKHCTTKAQLNESGQLVGTFSCKNGGIVNAQLNLL